MLFADIHGQDHIKRHLSHIVDEGRIPHAQLFTGPEGSGALPMAIAFSRYLLCRNSEGENSNGDAACNLKFEHLAHPDLHFAFPVASTDRVKRHPVSSQFMEEWRSLLKEQPYCNLYDWYNKLGIANKQGLIGVYEAHEIVKSLALKSYEGGYKVMIIWMAEKMNSACANKLLKLIEEPPEKTVFILISEDEEQLISTIRSRCQVLHFPPLPEAVISKGLMSKFDLEEAVANKIAHQSNGNFNKAADFVYQDSEDTQFEQWFLFWVRSAFKAKGNKAAVHDLISWSEELAKTGRETQKQFLHFSLDLFRQAMLLNFNVKPLVYFEDHIEGFSFEKFAPFVHENNIMDISDELQDAIYHIERNGNSKIILTDLSIRLTRLLHRKSA